MATNWMRDLKRIHQTVTSPTMAATAGNYIHISVPEIPNEGMTLKRLRIEGVDTSNTGTNSLDVRILDDAGSFREAEAAEAGSGEQYVRLALSDEVSASGPNSLYVSDTTFSDEIIYEDALNSNSMHLRIDTAAELAEHSQFRVEVWGDGLVRLREDSHRDPTHHQETHPVTLRWSTGDIWKKLDVRNLLDEDHGYTLFGATTDYVYFGLSDVWAGLWFHLNTANTTIGVTDTWEYWDGSNWSSLTIRDNCTDANATDETLFAYSGVIEWDEPADWTATSLDTAVGGTPPYDDVEYAPRPGAGVFPTADQGSYRDRFWVRFNLDDLTTQPTFRFIKKKPIV